MKIGSLSPGASVGTAFNSLPKGFNQHCEMKLLVYLYPNSLARILLRWKGEDRSISTPSCLESSSLTFNVHTRYLNHVQLREADDRQRKLVRP